LHLFILDLKKKNEIAIMTTPIIETVTKEECVADTVDPNDLDQLTDEELYSTLQKLEQEKELLAQQQHGDNQSHFNEMTMVSALYQTNTL
jgi:hypothetical protein